MADPTDLTCIRCGASIDATDSVELPDGPTCLACVDQAARTEAVKLDKSQRIRQAAGWSGLSVLAFVGAQLVPDEELLPRLLGGLGAMALVLAAWSFWRASRSG